jgi:Lipocalin-like domain
MISQERLRAYSTELQRISEMMSEVAQLRDAVQTARATIGHQQPASARSGYGGTYTYDGSKVVHHLDLSWNEVWAGTTNIRDVQRDGDRIIYVARPALLGKN